MPTNVATSVQWIVNASWYCGSTWKTVSKNRIANSSPAIHVSRLRFCFTSADSMIRNGSTKCRAMSENIITCHPPFSRFRYRGSPRAGSPTT